MMKLRIKFGSNSAIVECDASINLQMLKCHVVAQIELLNEPGVVLSLNNRTPLEGDEETLSDLGLVSGDLVYVLNPFAPRNEPVEMSVSTSNLCDTQQTASFEELEMSNSQLETCHSDYAMDYIPDSDSKPPQLTASRSLNEPILVRESTRDQLPQTVICAYSLSRPHEPYLALAIVVDILMSEFGYQICESSTSKNDVVDLNYSYSSLAGFTFQLICIPLHGFIFVHGFAQQAGNTVEKKMLRLKVADYVNGITSDALTTYKGACLSALSRLFKDNLAFPLLQSAARDSDDVLLTTLPTLIYELQLHVIKFLDVSSLLRLGEVCRYLHVVTLDPVLWRHFYVRDFGRTENTTLTQDWLDLYKKKHKMRRRMISVQQSSMFITPSDFSRPYYPCSEPPPFPYGPQGFVIGGEYDLRPTFTPYPFGLSRVFRPRFFPHAPCDLVLPPGVSPMNDAATVPPPPSSSGSSLIHQHGHQLSSPRPVPLSLDHVLLLPTGLMSATVKRSHDSSGLFKSDLR